MQPASHSRTIELTIRIPSRQRQLISSAVDYSILRTIRHAVASEENSEPTSPDMYASLPDLNRPGQQGQGSRSKSRTREISAPSMMSFGTGQDSLATTPAGRRQAARQLFEQYGIPRPPG